MNILRKPYWSPYVAGVVIGLLQIPIFWLLHASIGSSVAFHSTACSLLSFFQNFDLKQSVTGCISLLKHWWQLGFAVGIFIGAYISSPVWTKATSITSLTKRSLMAFCGGFIMLIGARMADGCTSGNGISDISLLSIGSMIVIASMFIGGILVVQLYKKI